MSAFSTYNSKRRLVQIVTTIFIIVLPFLSILRLDIPTLRFYFFNSVLWIDEFYLLFLVVMLILWIIVIFSMLYGRVWCGWMCPQTVLNELVWWMEAKARRWFRVPKSGGKPWRFILAVGTVSLVVAALSLLIGFNLVAFFVDPYRMFAEIVAGTLNSITTGFIIGIAILVGVDVMFWREKFCTKACPYGMMQMVFTDSKTQIVRYQTERNDECIDCKACVRDCMMGIDIRTSPYQTECIHCGVCVDSCAEILGRLDKPTLITFSWGGLHSRERWYEKLGFVDAKRWIVLGLTGLYALVLAVVIQSRQPLSISASGDRSTLYRLEKSGRIYNDYQVRISNRSLLDGSFRIECGKGHTRAELCSLHLQENPIFLTSREVRIVPLSISTTGKNLKPGPNELELAMVNTLDSSIQIKTQVVFFMPQHGIKQPPGEKAAAMKSSVYHQSKF